ncbi:hypothetical protein niasHS_011728 [Heterodera schachtii]|uniref:ATP-dependent DNA helicase n=1 Tax=Heterodera schachtii TaxID=97005 RepID=A0ABD2IBZ0_HETSC
MWSFDFSQSLPANIRGEAGPALCQDQWTGQQLEPAPSGDVCSNMAKLLFPHRYRPTSGAKLVPHFAKTSGLANNLEPAPPGDVCSGQQLGTCSSGRCVFRPTTWNLLLREMWVQACIHLHSLPFGIMGYMPSKQQMQKKKKKEEHLRRTEQSGNPNCPILDNPLSADGNGAASPRGFNTPSLSALQLSTPASSIGSKRRARPPKAADEASSASQNSVSLVDTQFTSATQNIEVTPRSKKGKLDDVDRPMFANEAIASTPVSTQRNRGRPAKRTGGPGRGRTNDSMSEGSSMDQSSEATTSVALLPNVPNKINFSTMQITFATTRNFACKIRRWADVGLYERDGETAQGPRSGPRFIETCWNDLTQFLNDAFVGEYLAYLASISQRKVVVVDPVVWEMGIERVLQYKKMTFGYDPNVPAEVILLPVHFPGHWTLIVHDVHFGTHFADSLPTPYGRLDWQLTDKIGKIISDILPSTVLTGIVNAVNLTLQHDGNSCGYFVCLYAESWLMNNRTFVLPDLSINYEKKRILWHINELYGTDNVPYHPREGVPIPCPIVYRHADEVQSISKAAEPMEVDDHDDIMIIEPETSGQAVNAILTQAQVAGENQADTLGLVSESCIPQEPIAQVDDAIFVRPKTPPRRSLRIGRRQSASISRSPSPAPRRRSSANAAEHVTAFTQRCYLVHKGWCCAAAAAKHYPEYSNSGKLGDKKCSHCGALLFPHEDSSVCCRQGRVVLPKLNPHPKELEELIVCDKQSREGKEFVRHMSRYNNLLQFASVSAGNKPCPAGGPMAVILNGEFHRRISSMQAGTTQIPGFGQLYILDPVEAMEQRRKNPTFTGEKITNDEEFVQGHQLNDDTLEILEQMIQENHPAAAAYKQAREQLQELLRQQSTEELRFFRMTLLNERSAPGGMKDPKLHPHQIITPSTGEGMFAIHADPTGAPAPKGIWVENKQGQLNEIAPLNPWTDSLTYPLIKPKGDDGYQIGIPYAKPAQKKRRSDQCVDKMFDTDAMSDDGSCETESIAASDAESVASTESLIDRFDKTRKFISLRDYCKYHLAIRDENVELQYHHILSCGGGLGQRWILDQAAKIDWQIASYLRRPDMDLRISTPKNLLHYLVNQYNKQQARQNPNARQKTVDDIGSVVRLSEKNVNSLQYWKKMYEDCNTIFARCHDAKKARLFITFTNNREWPEFKENIYKNGQMFTDRFDMWMRVWSSKIAVFHHELYDKGFFGTILGSGESMEFQGRGGPHAHIVAQTDLDAVPEVIQEYIWAHIPSLPGKEDDSPIAQMHREVRELMHMQLHRCSDSWCGPRDPNFGRCKKGFPAPFSKCTILHPDRPALYYRPSPSDGGAQIEVNGLIYDNSQVVPYNPYILLRYRVHHNVLFAYGNKANIKYALKYPFKGPGHCYVECKEESGNKIGIDEPAQYAKMNFRGATEAFAVVHSLPFAKLSHHVVHLSIHLPNQQPVVFRTFQLVSKAEEIQRGELPETPCSAYWKQWQNEWQHVPSLKDMLFEKVPEQFRWDNGKWVLYKRKLSKRPPIGRVVPVPPTDRERFALYALMRHFPGDPDHLKLVNGQQYNTFTEAALQHGLLEDDQIWHKTLGEAALHRWPDQMRWLFVSILVFGQPSNALELWNKYKDQMYNPQGANSAAIRHAREQEALADIDWRLHFFNLSCVHCGLPDPPNSKAKNTNLAVKEFFFGDDDLNMPPGQPNQRPQQNTPPLNSDQQKVFDAVVRAIQSDPKDQTVPRRFFIFGDGGTGKTFLFGQIIKRLRKPPYTYRVLATASTGCAAILLPYGKTAHSTFRLGRDVSLDKLPSIPLESFFARRIREAQLIIIDEITMLHNTVIEVIDRVCKEMAIPQHKDLLFGGKTVIFSGDFKQSLPVVPHEGLTAQVTACFQTSPLFRQFTTMKLTINQRLGQGQQAYLQMCRQIGLGETGEHFWIPPQFLVKSREELIDFVYPNFQQLLGNDKELLNRLILAPHIDTCDEINEIMMANVPGQVREYLSSDKPLDERPLDINEIESEVAALNRRSDSGMPPHRLRLKVGSVVVLLINKSDREGLINGTRIVLEELGDDRLVGRVINNNAVGGQVKFFIERTRNVYEDKTPGGIKYERLQFPIKPAFAMTILKGQGQTISTIGIDLERDVFSHGQLYTAFSRATDGNNVRVYAPRRETDAQGQAKVLNIVATKMLKLQ